MDARVSKEIMASSAEHRSRRIAIIGYSGAGKSSLARRIGETLDIPVLHLDQVHWMPGWVERSDEEARTIVGTFMNQSDWVIEGNYVNLLMDRRMRETSDIVMLDLPRWICFRRALRRARRYRGVTRPDMAPDCPERMDAEFVWWLLVEGRAAARSARFERVCAQYAGKTHVLHTQRDINRYLQQLTASNHCCR